MHTLCYDYTTCPVPLFPAPSFWLQHRYRHHPMYFRGLRKKRMSPPSLWLFFLNWTIVGICCESFLHSVWGSFLQTGLRTLGLCEMISGRRTAPQPGIILSIWYWQWRWFFISCVCMCARVRVCSEGNTQLNWRWIFTVYSHTSNHFTHPPFFVSL